MLSHFIERIFRYRDKIAAAVFLAVLARLVWHGPDLGLSEPAEDYVDILGCLIMASGHTLRVLALRHIGPSSRTCRLKTKRLVTGGPYRIVRNPLYLGNWLIASGLCVIVQIRWLLLVGPLLALILYYIVILAEERHLAEQFGSDYLTYRANTSRFFPLRLISRQGWSAFFERGTYGIFRSKEYQALLASGISVLLVELLEQLRKASYL
jgi:protein-S-isoprenylcysteine O-methyltransferase Ste14